MFKELQYIQKHQREGCVPMPPAVIGQPTMPGMSVLDKLCASLQQGDVALVLTRPDLATLTALVEKSWRTDDEFRILGKLNKLMEAKNPT